MMNQQVSLALLLLALTSLAAIGGGLNVREPFLEEECLEGQGINEDGVCVDNDADMDIPVTEMPVVEMPSGEMSSGEMPSGEMPSGEMPSGEMPSGEMPSGEMPEGFTGSMYAGF